MLETVYKRLQPFAQDIFYQGCPVSKNPGADVGVHLPPAGSHPDIVDGKGPLGGIYSALVHAKEERVVVVAADMPFIDPRIFNELVRDPTYCCVVPRWRNGHLEPLCALYHTAVTAAVEQLLASGQLAISALYKSLPPRAVKWLDIDAMIATQRLDGQCFQNINLRSDLERIDKRSPPELKRSSTPSGR